MNLHDIAAPFVGVVNPPVIGTWLQNTGETVSGAGKRTATFTAVPDQSFQVQALAGDALALIEGLNIQGIKQSVHMKGLPTGNDRQTGTGGDMLEFYGANWVIVVVVETWGVGDDAWTHVAVVKQIDAG